MTRGFSVGPEGNEESEASQHAPWEQLAIDTVGNFIEFWGFKRNQGRVWAYLFLKGDPLSAAEIQAGLELSKGAVSMITRELEQWDVIHRVRVGSSASWHFVAETDLMKMITRVLRQRESGVIARIKTDLDRAEELARADATITPEVLDRLVRMRKLATFIEKALELFVNTSQLDLRGLVGILRSNLPFSKK